MGPTGSGGPQWGPAGATGQANVSHPGQSQAPPGGPASSHSSGAGHHTTQGGASSLPPPPYPSPHQPGATSSLRIDNESIQVCALRNKAVIEAYHRFQYIFNASRVVESTVLVHVGILHKAHSRPVMLFFHWRQISVVKTRGLVYPENLQTLSQSALVLKLLTFPPHPLKMKEMHCFAL